MNEVRISLQDSEREFLKQYLGSLRIQTTVDAIDNFLSFENLYIGVTILEIVTGKEILPGTPNDIFELIDWIRDFDFPGEIIAGSGIGAFGKILNQVIDSITGAADKANPFD